MLRRLGIFGGSFNPVHNGHCIMAERFVQQMQLDRCLFIPTYISPFKQNEAPLEATQRLSMLRSVCRTNPRFAVDEYEIRRNEISYTINTIDYLQERYPQSEIFMLIGTDQAQSFRQWKEWQSLLTRTNLCIARRPFINAEQELQLLQELSLPDHPATPLDVPFIEISSRSIRQMCADEKSIRYLVPESVRRHIRKQRLYRAVKEQM